MSTWSDLDDWLSSRPGAYSAAVFSAIGVPLYRYQSERIHSSASLIKLAIALAVVRNGLLDRPSTATPYTLAVGDQVEGEGPIDMAPLGTAWPYRTLFHHMLHDSDNTASNLMIRLLDRNGIDMEAVTMSIVDLGASQTYLRRHFMDFAARDAGRDNLTTAADICCLLKYMLNSPVRCVQAILDHLVDSVSPEKIVAGVPPGTRVVHKSGDLPGVEHDAGIVWTPHGPYIVALLGSDLADVVTGQTTLSHASRLIYAHISGGTNDES